MTRYAEQDAALWVARNNGGQDISPLGRKLAYIVGCAFGGVLRAITDEQCLAGEWASPHLVHVTIRGQDLSTFDHDELTQIVYLAQRLNVRVSIDPVGPLLVRISAVPGDSRVSTGFQPMLEEAIARLERAYGEWPERLTRESVHG